MNHKLKKILIAILIICIVLFIIGLLTYDRI